MMDRNTQICCGIALNENERKEKQGVVDTSRDKDIFSHTLLLVQVRAIATTCKATFIALSGAQIYSPYVGDSERALRTAFKQARTLAPSILFLDEVRGL